MAAADGPPAHEGRLRRGGLHLRTRSAAIALVLAGVLVACGSDDDGGDAATEAMVLETCAPGRDDPIAVEVCECAYEELRERLGAEELEDLDRRLRDDPETVPAALQEVVLGCSFERVAPPTTKSPTTTTTSTSSSATTATTTSP